MRTITVFRNATMTTSEPRVNVWPTGYMVEIRIRISALYAISRFQGGGQGGAPMKSNFKPLYISETAKEISKWYSIRLTTKSTTRYRLKVVWKLYEVVYRRWRFTVRT